MENGYNVNKIKYHDVDDDYWDWTSREPTDSRTEKTNPKNFEFRVLRSLDSQR